VTPTGRTESPRDVSPFISRVADALCQKAQMTDVQRARLEKMELWKRKKAAEAAEAAKVAKASTPETVTDSAKSGLAAKVLKGTLFLKTALKQLCRREANCIIRVHTGDEQSL
jgi:hypothetical protein